MLQPRMLLSVVRTTQVYFVCTKLLKQSDIDIILTLTCHLFFKYDLQETPYIYFVDFILPSVYSFLSRQTFIPEMLCIEIVLTLIPEIFCYFDFTLAFHTILHINNDP